MPELKLHFRKEANLPQVLRSEKVRFFFVEESYNSGTIQSHTVKKRGHTSKPNPVLNKIIISCFIGLLLVRDLLKLPSHPSISRPSWCYLKQSKGSHPAGPALFILSTQHPQLLQLSSTFIGLHIYFRTVTFTSITTIAIN